MPPLLRAAAEVSTVNGKASIYEQTAAVGVLRVGAPPAPAQAPPPAAAAAAADGGGAGTDGYWQATEAAEQAGADVAAGGAEQSDAPLGGGEGGEAGRERRQPLA